MRTNVTLGHPILIFGWSLALLIGGVAIGAWWGLSRNALKFSLLAAVLMIVHDWSATIVWGSYTAKLIRATLSQNSRVHDEGNHVHRTGDSPPQVERSRDCC